MPSQGNYDHPSYLTRQSRRYGCVDGWRKRHVRRPCRSCRTCGCARPPLPSGSPARLPPCGQCREPDLHRHVSYQGYGTLGGTNTLTTNTTTATLGTLALGSSTANSTFRFADMDARLVAGGVLAAKNGTDATGTYKIMLEMYLDPGATWTGPPGS
jgi:hypothetical protein